MTIASAITKAAQMLVESCNGKKINEVSWIEQIPRARLYSSLIERRLTSLARINSFPSVFNDSIMELLCAGGKLIRPVLALCASEVTGKRHNVCVLDAAVALEMIHVSSLILDDIIDESPKRRGIGTLHKKYGYDVAIVSAGMLLLRAHRSIGETRGMRRILYDTTFKLLLGQAVETRGDVYTEKQYIRMIQFKTASLFEASMKLGAVANKLPDSVTLKLVEYGRNLGMSFQIRDDILDMIGSPHMLQKPVRMDLGKGKPTILGAKAYDSLKATPNGLAKIGKQSLVKLTMSRNILDAANQLANEYAHRAIAAVIDLKSTPGKRCLVELAEKATRRDS